MANGEERKKAELIKKTAAVARRRRAVGGKKTTAVGVAGLSRYIERYYAYVPPGDIFATSPQNLFGAARGHLDFAAVRPKGKSLLRVYNPEQKNDGWTSPHTVVEIVNDDMPFLLDSITAELNRQGLNVHLAVHPIIRVIRGPGGRLVEVAVDDGGDDAPGIAESFIRAEVTRQSGPRLKEIKKGLEVVIRNVCRAVRDWGAMRGKMIEAIGELEGRPPAVAKNDLTEILEFLQWAHDNQFTFLGYREFRFKGTGAETRVTVNHKASLGVLRDPKAVIFRELESLPSPPPAICRFIHQPTPLTVTKTNLISTIHRSVYMDCIGIKKFGANGLVTGQRMFAGLFTSSAYNKSVLEIPLLRRKTMKTIKRTGLNLGGHDGKALLNILENYPRDELLQISDEHLYQTALGILHLQERRKVALFIRRDDFERFISCLVYVPRDRYTTRLRLKIQKILEDAFAGEVSDQYAQLGESSLARVHITVRTRPGEIPSYDQHTIEGRLTEVARSWPDTLYNALVSTFGEEKGGGLHRRYADAFQAAYSEAFSPFDAVDDIRIFEEVTASGELGMKLYRADGEEKSRIYFKVFNPDAAIALSDVLPVLEHMGLKVMDEIPYRVRPAGGEPKLIMINNFGLVTRSGRDVDIDAVRDNFQDAFRHIWRGDAESDGFNCLVLGAGLAWRDVAMLRAYSKYLRQVGATFSQAYMEQALANNPGLANLIIDLFRVSFDPARDKGRDKKAWRIREKLLAGLDGVTSADEDRIFRRFLNLVDSTLRTNFFQNGRQSAEKSYISFKLDSTALEDLPLPRPFREIFVYSPRVEGVHLRFGHVARGGLRWSDRREDFRTEVLGLVKAQQVKNTVIIPVGSKGGFVVKQPPAAGDRDAFIKEGIECYKILISGLLDLTDNLKGNRVLPPKQVVRRDDDDPYLVVAADKGTATFSDIANGVSQDYGFWLGDAFASGGSVGYDHKKMGITARGAWESVKRHFREMGVDIQKHDFTVAGVGDMSGDVFGNGMLLSGHIKLVGAFNHMHIFVDPNPNPKSGIKERRRMFNLARSSWSDYNVKLISKGGGVFERSAKSIKLSPEIKRRFAIIKDTVTPNELMHAILAANVDLLWFGGIGTYVKASHETNAEVGDRANDAIRVDAPELRCRVVGEGANLGVTQRARVEFSLGGGRIYADSIDNSAGVDCSDHEVNIKILLDRAVVEKKLTVRRRNAQLAEMTDEVGELVLRDNYLQTQAINLIQAQGMAIFDNQVLLMRMLEKSGRLNRDVEFLPDDEVLIERAATRQGLTASETGVLMSYAKIWVYDELLSSSLPDDDFLKVDLVDYFPTPLRKKFLKGIEGHRLRREIIASMVTNALINRMGGHFVYGLMERTGMTPDAIARAYVIAGTVFNFHDLWAVIEGLDNKVPAAIQTAMLLDINRLMEWSTLWFLRHGGDDMDIGRFVNEFTKGVGDLLAGFNAVLPAHYREDARDRAEPYLDGGVPEDLALKVANLVNLFSACDVVRLALGRKMPVIDVARLYFATGTRFHLGRLRAATERVETQTHWQRLAAAALIEETYDHQLALTSLVLDSAGGSRDKRKILAAWEAANRRAVDRMDLLLANLGTSEINDLSMISVASRQLRALAASAGA
jgi:glutamate dehydrogenase